MSTPDHIASESPERNSALDPDPDVAGVPVMRAQALAPRGMVIERGASDVAFLLLFGGPAVVALLLLLVILPIRDGMKARDSARETYGELHSVSYAAGWETDSEIYSVRASLDNDLYSLDSGLWSVGLDLGALAHDVGADSRPGIRELQDAIGARRDELHQLRRSVDARFAQLEDSAEARFGGLEGAADAALDGHWDESSRRSSRDTRIVMGALWVMVAVPLAFGLAGLWVSWRGHRALAQPAEGM